PRPPTPERARPPAPEGPSTWTVSPGDNLWAIAEATLANRWRRSPTDAEVDVYWHRLIAANRSRLASPDAPELIFSGQVFVLPPS
ncbi:MAG: LysM peptidoglycan-binding domain-containing protein, partial [Acidimicrobiales bacterium]